MTKFIVFLIGVLFLFLGSTCYFKQVDVIKNKIYSAEFVEPIQVKVLEKMEAKDGLFSMNYHIRAEYYKNEQNVLISANVDEEFYQSVSIGEIRSLYADGFNWKSKQMYIEKLRSDVYWEKWWGVGGYLVFTMGLIVFFIGLGMGKK